MLFVQSFDDIHLEKSWVTVGNFDGVHRGHQALIRQIVHGAHSVGQLAVVVTFHPHPRDVLNGKTASFYLTLPSERTDLLSNLGVDAVVMLPFNSKLAAMSARNFVQALVTHLGMIKLVVGHDFALGRGREGNFLRLQELGRDLGYQVVEVDPIMYETGAISSSNIRSLILSGEVQQATQLLGRPYRVSGEVVPGDQRGRRVGVPTANLAVPERKLIPAPGVYACDAAVDGQRYASAVNIGVRPTFTKNDSSLYIEAHILDFSGDIYGKIVVLEFRQRLRDELRFESVEALIAQIRIDIQRTRGIITL